jgi:sugar/nucleoside kinase (ribokinase family)
MTDRFVCVGNLTLDTLYWVDRLPLLDDVATVRATTDCIGGRGAIVAALCAGLGLPVQFITTLPRAVKDHAKDFLQSYGALIDLIDFRDDGTPSRVTVIIGRAEQNCISLFHPGTVKIESVLTQRQAVRASSIAYFTTHDIAANIELLSAADSSTRIIVNMTAYMMRDRTYLMKCIERVHVLIGNESELSAFLEAAACRHVPELFQQMPQLETVFATRGAQGVEVFERAHDSFRLAAIPASVITPVGVGDAFAAGVCYGEYGNLPPAQAAEIGLRLAAISIASEATCPPARAIGELVGNL